jgi:hypothetical protein
MKTGLRRGQSIVLTLFLGVWMGSSVPARAAVLVEGDLAVDNYAMVLTGDYSGSNLTLQQTDVGGTHVGGPNATHAYSFTTSDHYLYVVAWSDVNIQQGLLFDFAVNGAPYWSSDTNFYTNVWRVYASGDPNTPPTLNQISTQIAAANSASGGTGSSVTWVPPAVGGVNDGTFPPNGPRWDHPSVTTNIDANARWIWRDSGNDTTPTPPASVPFNPEFDHGEFLIFRALVGVVEDLPPANGRLGEQAICIAGRSNNLSWTYGFDPHPLPDQVDLPGLPVGSREIDFANQIVSSINTLGFRLSAEIVRPVAPGLACFRIKRGGFRPFSLQVGPKPTYQPLQLQGWCCS